MMAGCAHVKWGTFFCYWLLLWVSGTPATANQVPIWHPWAGQLLSSPKISMPCLTDLDRARAIGQLKLVFHRTKMSHTTWSMNQLLHTLTCQECIMFTNSFTWEGKDCFILCISINQLYVCFSWHAEYLQEVHSNLINSLISCDSRYDVHLFMITVAKNRAIIFCFVGVSVCLFDFVVMGHWLKQVSVSFIIYTV